MIKVMKHKSIGALTGLFVLSLTIKIAESLGSLALFVGVCLSSKTDKESREREIKRQMNQGKKFIFLSKGRERKRGRRNELLDVSLRGEEMVKSRPA